MSDRTIAHRSTSPSRPITRRRALAAIAAPAVMALAAACGGGSATSSAQPTATVSPSPSASASSYPMTVTAANGDVIVAAQPHGIVSLSPTATEMLFAVGAGTQVKAVDDQSSYPANAPRTKLSGFQPNAEAVAGYNPDLVVISNDSNGLLDSLKALKIPTLLLPAAATLQDAYGQTSLLGKVTGHADQASAVVADMQKRISAATASVPAKVKGWKIYHEVDQTYYSVTSGTFIGSIYTMFGLKNIADAAGNTAGGYPKLSAEFVVKAAPDVIVLADSQCCGQSITTLAKRPAFAEVPAVKNGLVLTVPDDIASRWGPRTADLTETVAAALAKAGQ